MTRLPTALPLFDRQRSRAVLSLRSRQAELLILCARIDFNP